MSRQTVGVVFLTLFKWRLSAVERNSTGEGLDKRAQQSSCSFEFEPKPTNANHGSVGDVAGAMVYAGQKGMGTEGLNTWEPLIWV